MIKFFCLYKIIKSNSLVSNFRASASASSESKLRDYVHQLKAARASMRLTICSDLEAVDRDADGGGKEAAAPAKDGGKSCDLEMAVLVQGRTDPGGLQGT